MINSAPARRVFHVMSKPTGAVCNLDCEYGSFLSKEQLYRGSDFRMAPAAHEAYLAQLFAAHPADAEVSVSYQGGEPALTGLEFFARSVELAARFAGPGQSALHTIPTNGTLLDDQWGAFLAEHGFLVGLSIDGPREMHDAYRVDKGGKSTFDRVLRGWEVLRRRGRRPRAQRPLHLRVGTQVETLPRRGRDRPTDHGHDDHVVPRPPGHPGTRHERRTT